MASCTALSGFLFQSTRPRRARRLRSVIQYPIRAGFQSTRPRRARREGSPEGLPRDQVSIHAPAEGAT